jgi:hypothetical protein
MRPVRVSQTSWTAGELDAGLAGRIEVARYYSGAALMRNVLVRPQGGFRRRPGMAHVALLSGIADNVKLIPFAFNVDQSYLFVLSDQAFRVFTPDGTLRATVTGCPWDGGRAAQMNFAQSADTLLLFHPDFQPQRIVRGATHADWTRDTAPLTAIPTFDFGALTPAGTMTPSATSGSVTLTASANVFVAGHVGWELKGNKGRARITAVGSATSATATVAVPFDSTAAIAATDWTLEEPVMSSTRGWAECGTFHGGRLWLGGLRSRPSTVLASRVGAVFDFDPGTGLDDHAINATIATAQLNAVHQLVSGRALQILTSGAEHAVMSPAPITPRNLAIEQQTSRGIRRFVGTVEVDGATLFVERTGAALRTFVYEDVEQAFKADLLSLLAPHLIRSPVAMAARKGAAADDADHVLLALQDGAVTVLTTLRAQEVTAFSRWETTAGVVRSVAALASGEVFFAVIRAGAVRIEKWDEARLLDAGVRVATGSPVTSVSGLSHLDGRQVAMVLDGAYAGLATVASGAVTLPAAALVAEVGLPVLVQVTSLPLEPRDPTGALLGRKARITAITARVRAAGLFRLNDHPTPQRVVGASPLGGPPPVLTTDLRVAGLTGWRERPEVTISQAEPAPLEVLAVTTEMVIET